MTSRIVPSIISSTLLLTAAFCQTADVLHKHVTYLASDELKGRALPSPGLEAAANYIAGQFKAAGLDPAGDDHYFQSIDRVLMRPDWSGYKFTITNGKQTIHVLRTEILVFTPVALNFENQEILKVDSENGAWLKGLQKHDIEGKILVIRIVTPSDGEEAQENFQNALATVMKFSPA